jgi:Protein of unknown function (DUF2628)
MASYVVMEPAHDRTGEQAVFIRDAFAPLAVVLPVVWLLWHKLWIEAGVALIAMLGATAALEWLGLAPLAGLAAFLIGLYVALEGSALRIFAARRRGFAEKAVIDAASEADAEEHHLLTRPAVITTRENGNILPQNVNSSQGQNPGLFALPGTA